MTKLKILLCSIFCLFIFIGCSKKAESGTYIPQSRYVQVFTDPETGCQYLTTMDGGITPRLEAGGAHRGCKY